MNLFVICVTSAALLYVLTLPFIGKRAKKAHTQKKEIEENTHQLFKQIVGDTKITVSNNSVELEAAKITVKE